MLYEVITILGSSHNQVIVLAGNKNKIEGFLGKPLDNCEDIYSEDNNSDRNNFV